MLNFLDFQFEEINTLGKNQTIIEWKNIHLENSKLSNDTNNYDIGPYEIFQDSNGSNKFGIKIPFKRNRKGIDSILITYHLMCGILVLVASINFLVDPKVVPGRSGLLVTLFLVLGNFFSNAQVLNSTFLFFTQKTKKVHPPNVQNNAELKSL